MSIKTRNLAALYDEADKPFHVAEAPIGQPNESEILIKVSAVAINPVDGARQKLGFFVPSTPWVFGADAAGIVQSVGAKVDDVKPGERVMAMADEFFSKKSTNSAFQEYAVIGSGGFCKIPDTVLFTEACVMPLAISTASAMLFENETLNLVLPETEQNHPTVANEVIVVWGGSSSVGTAALQLAKAAGYRTVGIARARNFDLMKRCGADATFDYETASMDDDLIGFVTQKQWKLAGIAAAVTNEASLASCGKIAQKLQGHRFVSTSMGRGISPVPEMPEGVTASNCERSRVILLYLC